MGGYPIWGNRYHATWTVIDAEEPFGLAHAGQTIAHAPDAGLLELDVMTDIPESARIAANGRRRYHRRGFSPTTQ